MLAVSSSISIRQDQIETVLGLAQHGHEFVHQGLYVVEPFCNFESLHRVLVEVLV